MSINAIMLLQLGIELLLVVLVIVLWRRSGRPVKTDPARLPENFAASMEKFIADSEKISAAFAANLKNKKELSADLILKLDRRLSEYQGLLKQTEAALAQARLEARELLKPRAASGLPAQAPAVEGKANPAAPEVRALVLQLAKKGLSPEEIASRARLHIGEVELIIDLEKQFSL